MSGFSELQMQRIKIADGWARFVEERFKRALFKYKIGDSGELNRSIFYAGLSGGDDLTIRHQFLLYGRFRDMGVGKGQGIGDRADNGDVYRILGGGRKAKKWYSKTYAGQIAELRELMKESYGSQAVGIIKDELSKKIV